jgi:hypothetical protein
VSWTEQLRKLLVTHPAERTPARPPSESSVFQGPFLGPAAPLTAQFPKEVPRYFDYMAGVNANVFPRTEYPTIPNFYYLWATYQVAEIIRAMITFRTQQILSLSWNITPRKGSGFYAYSAADDFRQLLDRPDAQNGYNFEGWLRSVLVEVYVTDALTLWPVRSRLGNVIAFRQIDGQTIKPLIDYNGGIAAPPDAGFLQYIKGAPYASFTSDEIVYKPFRPRPWCIYGESRVENIIQTATLYQMHDNWTADYFMQGNIPEAALLLDPDKTKDWPATKIREHQQAIDEVYGQVVSRRRLHLMPPYVKALQELKSFSFQKDLPSWLVRIACVEFGVPSYMFVSETNKSTAKEVSEALYEAPLRYDLMSIKRLMDLLAEVAGCPELEFNFTKDLDYRLEAISGLVALCSPPQGGGDPIMTRDEGRAYLGLPVEGSDTAAEGGEQAPPSDDDVDDGGAGDDDSGDQKVANVVPIRKSVATVKPAVAGKKGRKFHGGGAVDKARLASGLAGVVYKRLRRQQSAIMKEALARARASRKKVINA